MLFRSAMDKYAEKLGIDTKKLNEKVSPIISFILFTLSGELDKSKKDEVGHRKIPGLDSESIDKLRIRIKELFLTQESKGKLLFEASTKNDIFMDLEWSINSRIFDSNLEDNVNGIKSVSLDFSIVNKSGEQKNIVLDTNKDGVNKILKKLNDILDKL